MIVGGITYRLFARQHLGEIAFCAVSAVEQVKGYGTRLMDKLKGCVACMRELRGAARRLLRRWAAARLRRADCACVREQVCIKRGGADAHDHVRGQQRGGLLPEAGAQLRSMPCFRSVCSPACG